MNFRIVLVSLLSAAVASCFGSTPPTEGHESSTPVQAEGASPADLAQAPDRPLDEREGSGAPAGTPQAAQPAAPARPLDLVSLMRQAGFTDASPANLDEFVHLPPGARGQAGSFVRGEESVRAALIEYPNPHYARPHVTDVHERNRVLPVPREAVASNGPWVLHVAASSRDSAEALATQLTERLGW